MKICIVTPAFLSGTPRVVKEADALSGAGYDVCVVYAKGGLETLRRFDEQLLETRTWRHRSIGWSRRAAGEKRRYWTSGLRQRLFQLLDILPLPTFVNRAYGRLFPELYAAAVQERAHLYIGHYPEGLAAAAEAASSVGVPFAFDAEDLHTGEGFPAAVSRRVERIEARYVPKAAYVSAASPLIAEALAKRYAIGMPAVLCNVFAWADRARIDGERHDRGAAALSLCWFSQTVGMDRGLQDAIKAVGLLKGAAELHVRGVIDAPTAAALETIVANAGAAAWVRFHDPVPPHELLSRVAEHDVGLALEQPVTLNRQIAVTNKLYLYWLAGLAVAATDIPGQRCAMEACPDAGFIYPPGDAATLAEALRRWIEAPASLARAKACALEAAQTRWNWENESRGLVLAVQKVLS